MQQHRIIHMSRLVLAAMLGLALVGGLARPASKGASTMKIRMTAILGLLLAGLLLLGPWPAAAYNGPPATPLPPVQDFQDVPTNSPFWSYVHNLYVDGVTSGYTCQPGGPVDPCVPPGNLPYFHPGSTVTRGQNAKFADNARRVLTGPHTGSSPNYGLFSAINTDESSSSNAGLYGKGATGVRGDSASTGAAGGIAGYFVNGGGGTGPQYGVLAASISGWGVYGASLGATAGQGSAGLVGQSSVDGGAGGVFTATTGLSSAGLVASGYAGAVLAGDGAALHPSSDGLDVTSPGGGVSASYAVYAPEPHLSTDFSFYGAAHIRGSNIAGAAYESEVVYNGAAPLALGRVVALDSANAQGGPLGVVPADATNAGAAVGVISYRLRTVMVNGDAKTVIEAQATAVRPGDRAYMTILGRVTMPLPLGAKVGARLALGADGAVGLAAANAGSFGRVASRPNAAGPGDVLVSFK